MAHISDSSAELVKTFDVSEREISEHCESLRLQVNIARKTVLPEDCIHNESNTLMNKIEPYEHECMSAWRAIKDSTKVVVEDLSKRIRAFVAEQHAFLESGQASGTHYLFLFLVE